MGGGGKGSAPKPVDPYKAADAQTGANIGAAIANQTLGNVNQVTPYGTLNYNQTGSMAFEDPFSGKTYNLPKYTATTTLSKPQQDLLNTKTDTATTMAGIANKQATGLASTLGKSVSIPGMQAFTLNSQNQKVGLGDQGKIKTSIAKAGPIDGSINKAGPITKSYITDFSADRQKVEDALFARLNPKLEQDRARLETSLSNRGIKLGGRANDRAMFQQGQKENDARMAAILGAGQEQGMLATMANQAAQFQNAAQAQQYGQNANDVSVNNAAQQQTFLQNLAKGQFANQAQQQGFGQDLAAGQFFNQGKQQEFQNAMQKMGFNNNIKQQTYQNQVANKNNAINSMNSLLSGGQVQNPMWAPAQGQGIAPTDISGLMAQNYNQQLQNYQAQQQAGGGLMGGLFSLGSAGLMMSDVRLKQGLQFLGMLRDLPIWSWQYVWGGPRHTGVLAQDMLALRPAAVVRVGPWLAVDYGRL